MDKIILQESMPVMSPYEQEIHNYLYRQKTGPGYQPVFYSKWHDKNNSNCSTDPEVIQPIMNMILLNYYHNFKGKKN